MAHVESTPSPSIIKETVKKHVGIEGIRKELIDRWCGAVRAWRIHLEEPTAPFIPKVDLDYGYLAADPAGSKLGEVVPCSHMRWMVVDHAYDRELIAAKFVRILLEEVSEHGELQLAKRISDIVIKLLDDAWSSDVTVTTITTLIGDAIVKEREGRKVSEDVATRIYGYNTRSILDAVHEEEEKIKEEEKVRPPPPFTETETETEKEPEINLDALDPFTRSRVEYAKKHDGTFDSIKHDFETAKKEEKEEKSDPRKKNRAAKIRWFADGSMNAAEVTASNFIAPHEKMWDATTAITTMCRWYGMGYALDHRGIQFWKNDYTNRVRILLVWVLFPRGEAGEQKYEATAASFLIRVALTAFDALFGITATDPTKKVPRQMAKARERHRKEIMEQWHRSYSTASDKMSKTEGIGVPLPEEDRDNFDMGWPLIAAIETEHIEMPIDDPDHPDNNPTALTDEEFGDWCDSARQLIEVLSERPAIPQDRIDKMKKIKEIWTRELERRPHLVPKEEEKEEEPPQEEPPQEDPPPPPPHPLEEEGKEEKEKE